MAWTAQDIPDQSGRTALITGATDGLGLETAKALAAKGARVLAAGRNPVKGQAAVARVRDAVPLAEITFEQVELGELASVRALAERLGDQPLDMLVNNAGLMALPTRQVTADGFEMQFGVNYLSHFALTGWLLPNLRRSSAPRVVSLSSLAHLPGRIHFEDLQATQGYSPFRSYAQSKLAMLMFAQELQRRSDAHGWGLLSAAAHPGFARTNLMTGSRGPDGKPSLGERASWMLAKVASHDAAAGALPQLMAAASPDTRPGGYYGPDGPLELKGAPKVAKVARHARDRVVAARLWDVSQELTGFPFGAGA